MPAQHCPHCHSELPERASFCGACGRRIEGWSNLPSASQSGRAAELPGSQEATRQMEPTPSLLRAAKLARQKREAQRKAAAPPPPVESESMMLRAIKRPRAPLWIAMVLVAVAGGVGGFLVMKQHRRAAMIEREPPPETVAPPVPSGSVAPSGTALTPVAPIAPLPAPARPKHPRAHRLTPLEVPIAQKQKQKPVKPPKGNGLPHKAVSTDSRVAQTVNTRATTAPSEIQDPYPTVQTTPSPTPPPQQLAMPSAPHEEPASEGEPPPSEADQQHEAQVRIDADGVRLVVKQHLPQVHACYSRAFKDSSPGGRIEIGFAINPAGRAGSVRTEVNTTDSAELARCLEGRVREWQFPRPVGGEYELIYPFVFAAGS